MRPEGGSARHTARAVAGAGTDESAFKRGRALSRRGARAGQGRRRPCQRGHWPCPWPSERHRRGRRPSQRRRCRCPAAAVQWSRLRVEADGVVGSSWSGTAIAMYSALIRAWSRGSARERRRMLALQRRRGMRPRAAVRTSASQSLAPALKPGEDASPAASAAAVCWQQRCSPRTPVAPRIFPLALPLAPAGEPQGARGSAASSKWQQGLQWRPAVPAAAGRQHGGSGA